MVLQSWKNQLVEPGAVIRCVLSLGVLWENSFFVVEFVGFFHAKKKYHRYCLCKIFEVSLTNLF